MSTVKLSCGVRKVPCASNFVIGLLASSMILAGNSALAMDPVTVGSVTFTPGLEIGAALFRIPNQAFGSSVSYTGLEVDKNGDRFEGYIKPSFAASVDVDEFGDIYGKVSVASGLTRGSTDGAGITRDDPESTDLDDAFIGWKNDGVILGEKRSLVDFSVGRQNLRVGTGFLIGGGHYNQGHEGTYWISPRLTFDETAIFKSDYQDFHLDIFHLRTRLEVDVVDHSEDFTLNGANAEYSWPGVGSVGFTIINTKDSGGGRREGLNTKSLRASYNLTSSLSLSGEYATQHGRGSNDDADGWYMSASYSFLDTAWTPVLTYQYAYFGENYDPLLYGCYSGWGQWCQGEISGEYLLFNSNEKSQMIKFAVSPSENLNVGVIAYDIEFAERPVGISSKSFAHEINFFADFSYGPNWLFGVMAGYATPGQGATEAIGGEDAKLLQGYIIYTL